MATGPTPSNVTAATSVTVIESAVGTQTQPVLSLIDSGSPELIAAEGGVARVFCWNRRFLITVDLVLGRASRCDLSISATENPVAVSGNSRMTWFVDGTEHRLYRYNSTLGTIDKSLNLVNVGTSRLLYDPPYIWSIDDTHLTRTVETNLQTSVFSSAGGVFQRLQKSSDGYLYAMQELRGVVRFNASTGVRTNYPSPNQITCLEVLSSGNLLVGMTNPNCIAKFTTQTGKYSAAVNLSLTPYLMATNGTMAVAADTKTGNIQQILDPNGTLTPGWFISLNFSGFTYGKPTSLKWDATTGLFWVSCDVGESIGVAGNRSFGELIGIDPATGQVVRTIRLDNYATFCDVIAEPTGPAEGDLSASYPKPSVAALRGVPLANTLTGAAGNCLTLNGGGSLALQATSVTLNSGLTTTYDSNWVTVGAAHLTPGSGTFYFKSVVAGASGRTVYVRVYNQSDSTEVFGTSLSSSSSTPSLLSCPLVAGGTPGFPLGAKLYLMQLKADAGASSSSLVSCYWGAITPCP